MSPKEKDSDFKVVDRRASSGTTSEPSTQKGEGFVMKETPESEAPFQIDFSTLVFSLATGALIHMGLAPDPSTKKVQKNLEMARQNIEILTMLKEKTKGNLTPEEDQLLENLLAEVRVKFVEASKK